MTCTQGPHIVDRNSGITYNNKDRISYLQKAVNGKVQHVTNRGKLNRQDN